MDEVYELLKMSVAFKVCIFLLLLRTSVAARPAANREVVQTGFHPKLYWPISGLSYSWTVSEKWRCCDFMLNLTPHFRFSDACRHSPRLPLLESIRPSVISPEHIRLYLAWIEPSVWSQTPIKRLVQSTF